MVFFPDRIQKKLPLCILLLIASVLSLVSCLDLEAEMKISRNGSVVTDLTYRLDSAVADYGRGFGADEPWPVPLAERDFRQRCVSTEGTELKRYRIDTDADGRETISVRLKSESVESLAIYLGLDLSVTEDSDAGSLTLRLPDGGGYTEIGQESRDAVDALVGDSSFSLTVRPPTPPEEAISGMLDGRTAVFSVTLADVLYNRAAPEWTVRW